MGCVVWAGVCVGVGEGDRNRVLTRKKLATARSSLFTPLHSHTHTHLSPLQQSRGGLTLSSQGPGGGGRQEAGVPEAAHLGK